MSGRCGLIAWSRKPAEDTEKRGQDIDTEDGADQLKRGVSCSTTSDEDEPVLSKRYLQEEHLLDVAEVLDETSAGQEQRATHNPRSDCQQDTKHDGDDPDLGQLPLHRTGFVMCIVVGDGDSGQVGEKSQEDDQIDTDGFVDNDHGGDQVDFQVEAERNTVLDIRLHTLEDLSSDLDSRDDGTQPRCEEHNIGGCLGSFGSSFDGNTAIGFLKRWGVIDTVTSHGSKMPTLLEHFHDLVLVFGEDFSETVGTFNQVMLSSTAEAAVDKSVGVVNLGTQCQHLASLLGDSDSITRKHLDLETQELCFGDGLRGVFTWRVEHRKHSEQVPGFIVLLDSDTKGTEATTSEFGGLCSEHSCSFFAARCEV